MKRMHHLGVRTTIEIRNVDLQRSRAGREKGKRVTSRDVFDWVDNKPSVNVQMPW